MRTINGGEDYSFGDDEPYDLGALIDNLIARADGLLRLLAAAPHAGHIALPSEIPFPPDSINLN